MALDTIMGFITQIIRAIMLGEDVIITAGLITIGIAIMMDMAMVMIIEGIAAKVDTTKIIPIPPQGQLLSSYQS